MPALELLVAPLTLIDPAMVVGVLCGCALFAICYRLTLASVRQEAKSAAVCTVVPIGTPKRVATPARVSCNEDRLLNAA